MLSLRKCLLHPLQSSEDPDEFVGSVPRVRVHCNHEEKIALCTLLDKSKRLALRPSQEVRSRFAAGVFAVPKSLEIDRLILDARPAICWNVLCGGG